MNASTHMFHPYCYQQILLKFYTASISCSEAATRALVCNSKMKIVNCLELTWVISFSFCVISLYTTMNRVSINRGENIGGKKRGKGKKV